jgi:putative flippase GtrA
VSDFINKNGLLSKFRELFLSRETIAYTFFGFLTTLVNWSSYLLIKTYLHQSTAFSNSVAWFVAVIFAYITNKRFVFRSHQNNIKDLIREFILFILARIISLGFDTAFMIITVDMLFISDELAKIASNIFVLIINFVASKLIVFKSK